MLDWLNAAWAAGSIVLAPFGDVSPLLQEKNPWYGFDSQDPILLVSRIQQIQNGSCRQWIDALKAVKPGPAYQPKLEALWSPWTDKELDGLKDCDHFPCSVKLDEIETNQMTQASPPKRVPQFFELIAARVQAYLKNQIHKTYEYAEIALRPIPYFNRYKEFFSGKFPAEPTLFVRKLDFGSKKMKVLHQVVDRRVAVSPSQGITIWLQDIYTDHYFDAWGEWTQLVCSPQGMSSKPILIQMMAVELDLLKKTDLFSRLARGKMRSAVNELGQKYLDSVYQKAESIVSSP